MPRNFLAKNVFDAAVDRMVPLFEAGHRVVVSFSAGKDSGVCVEVCLIAMEMAGVGNGGQELLDVVMRDEEIMYPGTFEYAARVAARPEINFHWLIANQPITNVFNRADPYWWVFDPSIPPEQWVRQPPDIAEYINGKAISSINSVERFPHLPGKKTISVLGLRASESARRMLGTFSAGGFMFSSHGTMDYEEDWDKHMHGARPIYDWNDSDIWKAIHDFKWDYNEAYDVMNRMGVPRRSLRIAPPTLNQASVKHLDVAARAWPRWFDKVCKRLPGIRTAAQFGTRACQPYRKYGESWEDCFRRECLDDPPAPWIVARAKRLMEIKLKRHSRHASTPFPDSSSCRECGQNGSWKDLALTMYNGDPFCLRCSKAEMPYVEPEFFRAGMGTWAGGAPTWEG